MKTLRPLAIASICTIGLAGCMQTMSSGDDMMMEQGGTLTARISGKTLTNESGASIIVGADGRLSGIVEGAWTERDGQFCRTLTAPERLAGTLCQNVRFNDDGTVTFLTGAAGETTWTIS